MPLRDYQCHRCGRVQEILERHTSDDPHTRDWPTCCGLLMYMLPAAPSFTVTGYSAKNGYAKEK